MLMTVKYFFCLSFRLSTVSIYGIQIKRRMKLEWEKFCEKLKIELSCFRFCFLDNKSNRFVKTAGGVLGLLILYHRIRSSVMAICICL